jgi:MraZ protein
LKRILFYDAYPLKRDSKNRLALPADIRKLFAPDSEGPVLIITLRNKIPWIYPAAYYERLVKAFIPPKLAPSEYMVDYTRLKFALASKLPPWDAQGRLVLPDWVVKQAKLDFDLTLLGVQDHMELWNTKSWSEEVVGLMHRSADIEKRAEEMIEKQNRDRPVALTRTVIGPEKIDA